MSKFDKTKENIGIDKLDQESRKELFDKFVTSGGKVVDEREKKKHLVIDRQKQKEYQKKADERKQKYQQEKPKKAQSKITKAPVPINSEPDFFTLFLQRIKLKFKLKFMGVTQFNGFYFHKSFLKKFNNIYKPALMEIQMIYMDFFKHDLDVSRRIIISMDKLKPIYFELIEMIGNIYDRTPMEKIVESYVNYSNIPKRTSDLRPLLLDLYKKLYILKPYQNLINYSFEKAIEIHIKTTNKKTSFHTSSRKKVRNSLFLIFHKLYPRLHLLFCKYENRLYDEFDQSIEKILNIDESEKPGIRTAMTIETEVPIDEKEIDVEEEKEEEKTEEEKMIAESEKKGFDLMYNLNMKLLRTEYDKAGLFRFANDNDKVLTIYLLFKEFDREYSFILTTNKVQYNQDYETSSTYDFNNKLKTMYDEMRKPLAAFQNYSKIMDALIKAKKEKPSDKDQYIKHTKRLEEILAKKNEAGNIVRLLIKQFMENLTEILKVLIDDMEKEQRYILNPQDEIKFDTHIEGTLKLNTKKIYQAILLTYSYSLAFIMRLSPPAGDLYISKNTKEEEGSAQSSAAGKADAEKAETDASVKKPDGEGDDSEDSKSILEELDDLV